MVNRNICELIGDNDIAEVNGRKVLGGLMGVAKAGNDRNSGPQRLIMNIKVSNWAQNVIAGDMPQLPTSGQWRCLVLEDEETLVLSGKDLICCFYVFEIPKPWRKWMAFAPPWPVVVFILAARGKSTSVRKLFPWWISATRVIQHVHRRLWPLRYTICAVSSRRQKFAATEVSRAAVPLELVCSSRGKVSREAAGQNELYVGRGTADSFWQPSKWENPFRVSKVGSAARAVELYAKWLITQKDLLFQLLLDGKRLLCHCNGSSPCHIDSLIAIWRSHRLPLLFSSAIDVASVH